MTPFPTLFLPPVPAPRHPSVYANMHRPCPTCGAAAFTFCVRVAGDPETMIGHGGRR